MTQLPTSITRWGVSNRPLSDLEIDDVVFVKTIEDASGFLVRILDNKPVRGLYKVERRRDGKVMKVAIPQMGWIAQPVQLSTKFPENDRLSADRTSFRNSVGL